MKLLSQGRLVGGVCLAGLVLLAAGRAVPSPQASLGLTAAAAVCLIAGLVLLRGLRCRFQKMLVDAQSQPTTKA
jgi:hypothetical protein